MAQATAPILDSTWAVLTGCPHLRRVLEGKRTYRRLRNQSVLSSPLLHGHGPSREGNKGIHIRRREFIVTLASAVTWPFAALAQQPGNVIRIGLLWPGRGIDSVQPEAIN